MHQLPDTPGESTALRILGQAVATICAAAMALSAIAILISFVLIGWAVVMRYVFNAAPAWVDELVGHLLVATVMLAVAQTFRRGEHIGVDVLVQRLSPAGKRWATAWAAVACAAVATVLVVSGGQTAMLARTLGLVTEGHLEWPVWWLMLMLPLGGALLLLATLEALWRTWIGQPLRPASSSQLAAPGDAP